MRLKKPGRAVTPLVPLVCMVFMVGCVPATKYDAPTMQLSDTYSVIVPVKADRQINTQWWTEFNDPVLNKLVSAAFVDNVTVAEAAARVQEAEANVRQTGTFISGDGRLEIENSSLADESGEAGLTALFDIFGAKRARRKAANARLESEKLGELDARQQLLNDLAQSYVQLRFFQQSLLERHEDLRSRMRTMNDIETQLNIGAATELDIVRARALVAELRVELPGLRASIVRERNRISTLLGKPAGSIGIDLSYRGQQPRPPGLADIGVPADLLRMRPDVRRAEQLYAAAVSEIDAARADRFPRLSLSGAIQAPFDSGASERVLTAGLVLPIFSQPELAAAVDANTYRANQAYLQWRAAVLTAVEEVQTALSAFDASQEAVRSAREVVKLNERALSLSRRLLDSRGNITVLDLLDRERTLTNSRSVLSRNQRDLASEYVALRVALGARQLGE